MKLKSLRNDERGVAWTFISGTAAIFITITCWYILTGPSEEILKISDNLRPPENTLAGQETRDLQVNLWNLIPILIVVGVILWMFVRAYREIYGSGYG